MERRYRACDAEALARRRARRPKRAKLARCRRLRRVVEAKLALEWSPQQIASWLVEQYPGDPEMRVSHETIYMSLFIQGRGALRQELHRCLRSGRAIRRPRGWRQPDGRGILRDMVLISERPAEVKDRAVPGHWEGDLIFGKRMTAIGTLVERSTRYVMLFALPNGHTADRVRTRWPSRSAGCPPSCGGSLTLDQGREFAEHVAFKVDTGVQVSFCDPKSPWQRGSNENTNGLLGQYFPRNSDLSAHTQAQLNAVARRLKWSSSTNARLEGTISGTGRGRCVNRLRSQHFASGVGSPAGGRLANDNFRNQDQAMGVRQHVSAVSWQRAVPDSVLARSTFCNPD